MLTPLEQYSRRSGSSGRPTCRFLNYKDEPTESVIEKALFDDDIGPTNTEGYRLIPNQDPSLGYGSRPPSRLAGANPLLSGDRDQVLSDRNQCQHGSKDSKGFDKFRASMSKDRSRKAGRANTMHSQQIDRPEWRCLLQAGLESVPVTVITVIAIVINAIVIGFETDQPDLPYWDFVENLFLGIFTVELVLRLLAYGFVEFLSADNPDQFWNIFDFIIVAFGLLNTIAVELSATGLMQEKDATLFRVVRIMRVLRILRVIRVVRFLKQLYLLAYGFVEGAMAVFWIGLLACAAIYVCAILLTRTYGNTPEDSPDHEFFVLHFGSVLGTMFTLFQIMSSPSIGNYREVIFDYPPLVLFMVLFILFGSFGMNGLLTGVISESIIDKNQARISEEQQEQESKRDLVKSHASELFDNLDSDGGGTLSRDELLGSQDTIVGVLAEAGLKCTNADLDDFFDVMDHQETGAVGKDDFVCALLELCKEVRPLSIMRLQAQLTKCLQKLDENDAKFDAFAQTIDKKVDLILQATIATKRAPDDSISNGSPVSPPSRGSGTVPEARRVMELARNQCLKRDAFNSKRKMTATSLPGSVLREDSWQSVLDSWTLGREDYLQVDRERNPWQSRQSSQEAVQTDHHGAPPLASGHNAWQSKDGLAPWQRDQELPPAPVDKEPEPRVSHQDQTVFGSAPTSIGTAPTSFGTAPTRYASDETDFGPVPTSLGTDSPEAGRVERSLPGGTASNSLDARPSTAGSAGYQDSNCESQGQLYTILPPETPSEDSSRQYEDLTVPDAPDALVKTLPTPSFASATAP